MAEITKPSGLNKIWAATGVISTPSDLKISTGNIIEKPAYDYFNFWQNRVDTFNAFMNQHGYPTWDADTEYQAEKSYVMHSNGTIYRCIVTHTNQAIPNATYWEIAFADYGSSYTKVEADAKYLTRTNNLSDVSNVNTARTNLSVYSISQVDSLVAQATTTSLGRVELATSTEAQTGTDAVRAITPSTLASVTATETRAGLIELATSAEVQLGSDTVRAVTPAGLASRTASDTRPGIVELATSAEVQAGTDTARAVTPAGLAACTATETRVGVVELATDAEAQAFTANKIIDGAKLNTAFKGSNQSLASSGYQKLPGGLIIQWGSVAISSASTATFTLPITFPTAGLAASATAVVSDNTYALVDFPSKSQIRIKNVYGNGQEAFNYIAIGY